MSDPRFSGLSYRELQALAVKYKVPGNINVRFNNFPFV